MRVLAVILACLFSASPGWAQSMGVLTSPINATSVAITSSGTSTVVAAQGAGVKVRVLGFFFSSQNQARLVLQDAAALACPGIIMIATAGSVNAPVAPPGYFCETAANTALQAVASQLGSPSLVNGVVIWQASQ